MLVCWCVDVLRWSKYGVKAKAVMAIARYSVHSPLLDQNPMASANTKSIPWNFEYARIAVVIPRITAFLMVEAETHFLKE